MSVPMTDEEFATYVAELRDWKQDMSKLADCLQTMWDKESGGGLTAQAPLVIASGEISLSTGAGLDVADDALVVKAAAPLSVDATDGVKLTTGDGLKVDGDKLTAPPSADSGNVITPGTDKLHYYKPSS